ncbi:MAG: hypothetical protein EOM45_11100 [Clostridia bacterium]|nr:hypothetical protein [Clostridia bacterium]
MDARDLSFRAKRIDNQEWEYGDVCNGEYGKVFILYDNDAVITCKKKELTSWGFIEVNPKTVGMYTGFQDSEGLRIYDGDILKLTGSYEETDGSMQEFEEIREVIYKHGCFYGYSDTEFPYWTPLFETAEEIGLEIVEKIEIVGNIHDEGGTYEI